MIAHYRGTLQLIRYMPHEKRLLTDSVVRPRLPSQIIGYLLEGVPIKPVADEGGDQRRTGRRRGEGRFRIELGATHAILCWRRPRDRSCSLMYRVRYSKLPQLPQPILHKRKTYWP
jgi:hypothetical protein